MYLNFFILVLHFLNHFVFFDFSNTSLNSFLIVGWYALSSWSGWFLRSNNSTQDCYSCIQIDLPNFFDRLNFLFSNFKSKYLKWLRICFNLFESILSYYSRMNWFSCFRFFSCIDRIKIYQSIVLEGLNSLRPVNIDERAHLIFT